jgi:hypothetical protein
MRRNDARASPGGEVAEGEGEMKRLRSLWRFRRNQPEQDDATYFVAFVFIGFALLFVALLTF